LQHRHFSHFGRFAPAVSLSHFVVLFRKCYQCLASAKNPWMRQKRDKTDLRPGAAQFAGAGAFGTDATLVDYVAKHAHIPRDADGDPIFWILPPGVQASYDRKLAGCEAGWAATGDPLFVAEASTLARLHRQPAPAWLDDAVYRLAGNRRTKGHAKRAAEAAAHLMRYFAVRSARRAGLSWERAWERATEILAGTHAAGEPDTVRRSYIRVSRDTKAGRGVRYHAPKEQKSRGSLGRGSR
jgi:hypothetical protein